MVAYQYVCIWLLGTTRKKIWTSIKLLRLNLCSLVITLNSYIVWSWAINMMKQLKLIHVFGLKFKFIYPHCVHNNTFKKLSKSNIIWKQLAPLKLLNILNSLFPYFWDELFDNKKYRPMVKPKLSSIYFCWDQRAMRFYLGHYSNEKGGD